MYVSKMIWMLSRPLPSPTPIPRIQFVLTIGESYPTVAKELGPEKVSA